MKIVARFFGTVAGGLFALLALGGGIVSDSLVSAVIAAFAIGVIWVLIPPIGRVFSPLLDALVLGIPALFFDAGLLLLITKMLDGMFIQNFGWALIAGSFIMIGRLLGTGIVKNANNPEGLSIFGDIHAEGETLEALAEGEAEIDVADAGQEGEFNGGEDEVFPDSDADPTQPMYEAEIGEDQEPDAYDTQQEEGSLPLV